MQHYYIYHVVQCIPSTSLSYSFWPPSSNFLCLWQPQIWSLSLSLFVWSVIDLQQFIRSCYTTYWLSISVFSFLVTFCLSLLLCLNSFLFSMCTIVDFWFCGYREVYICLSVNDYFKLLISKHILTTLHFYSPLYHIYCFWHHILHLFLFCITYCEYRWFYYFCLLTFLWGWFTSFPGYLPLPFIIFMFLVVTFFA